MLTVSRFGSTTQNSCAPLERQRTAFSRISALVFEGDNTSITNSGEPRKLSSSSVASHLCCETYATSAPRRSYSGSPLKATSDSTTPMCSAFGRSSLTKQEGSMEFHNLGRDNVTPI